MRCAKILVVAAFAALSLSAWGQADEREFEKRVIAAVATYKEGKTEDAIKAFQALHEQNPRSSDVQSWLGFLYLRTDKHTEAVKLLEQAETQRPTDPELLNNLGNAYLATGVLDKALVKFQAVIKLNPKLAEPHYNSGTIFLRQKNWQKALGAFQEAAKLDPKDPFVQNNLGVTYEAMKDDPKAIAAFQKAVALRPDNVTFARNLGMLLSKHGKPEAIPHLEKAYSDSADEALTLSLANAYLRAGKNQEALKLYEKVRESQDKSVAFWFNLGVLRNRTEDEKGAEQAYRRAMQINPNDLDVLNNLGLLVYRRGDYEEATLLFDRLAGLNPSSIAAKLNFAASAARAGQMDRAIEAWKVVIRAEPARVPVRMDLANALFEAGDVAGARYHYNQVVLMSKNNAEALNGMGLCHLKEEKLPQAEAAFRSAIELDSKLMAAHNNLAITLERGGQRAAAIKVLENAAKINPQDEDIQRNLQRMRAGS